ncbi:helix-turn-helix domain-containing protein [Streptomyces subrutilus]|uniref:helix-turn-helix domain-containing protein n=1 Tax=Streptomyces subrutilus TaxID=36818 RepID=UPI0009A06541
MAGRPVHEIAARWCFTNAPAFSRAFRAAYGLSPTEFRRAAAQEAAAAGRTRAPGGADPRPTPPGRAGRGRH